MPHVETETRQRDVDDPASPVEWVRSWATIPAADVVDRGEAYVREQVKSVVQAVRLRLAELELGGVSINVSALPDAITDDLVIVAWGPYRMPIPDGVSDL